MRATVEGIKQLAEAAADDAARSASAPTPLTPHGVEFVREAERLGVDSVWVPEFWAGDALTPLAYLAARTTHDPAGDRHRAARRAHAGDAGHVGACRCRRCPAAGSCSASAPAARR